MSTLVLTLATLLLAAAAPAAARLPTALDLETFRRLPPQHNGYTPPIDTLARAIVHSVTGARTPQGRDPVLLLLAWTFEPTAWRREPLISIPNASLRRELKLDPDRSTFTYDELAKHRPLLQPIDAVRRRGPGVKLDPLEAEAAGIYERLLLLRHVFTGAALPLIPSPDSVIAPWQPIGALGTADTRQATAVQVAWASLRSAFLADDAQAFTAASEQLALALAALPAGYRPTAEQLDRELHYNRLQPYRRAWLTLLAATGLTLAATLLALSRSPRLAPLQRAVDLLALAAILLGFGLLSYGMWLRWHIAERLPAANMFESLLFVGWGAGVLAIAAAAIGACAGRARIVALTATAMAALALLLADCLPIDSFIRPVAPVLLDTIWMSLHVPVIMGSYAVLALAVLVAHAQLVLLAVWPRRPTLAAKVDGLHYWFALVGSWMLLAGIITGSMWGAASWGRYWGWDPKEVWSLVAFLAYMTILHVRIDHERIPGWAYAVAGLLAVALLIIVSGHIGRLTPLKLLAVVGTAVAAVIFVLGRGPLATALKSVVAFWLIVMTYVGVNYVLGTGLHSYGFGAGPVVRWMFLLGGIDLALMAVCSAVYILRARLAAPPPAPAATATRG
jgi:ABC-type transport system involved in cytochrome c biogenesis permease subunit